MGKEKVIISADGSNTVVSKEFGVPYHSIHGALEESIHIFLSAGIYYQSLKNKNKLDIFEMGFGTGLNAWLAFLEANRLSIEINYTGVELYPLPLECCNTLNYPSIVQSDQDEKTQFQSLHELKWEEHHVLSNTFSFQKHLMDIHKYKFDHSSFDIIFFDAFAPSSQEDLWEVELHQKLFLALKPGGCLVTYCAKGSFKRMLKQLGYELQALNGPGRKHEMTRALKP